VAETTGMGPKRPRAEKTRPRAETFLYQFRRIGLSAICNVSELVIGYVSDKSEEI